MIWDYENNNRQKYIQKWRHYLWKNYMWLQIAILSVNARWTIRIFLIQLSSCVINRKLLFNSGINNWLVASSITKRTSYPAFGTSHAHVYGQLAFVTCWLVWVQLSVSTVANLIFTVKHGNLKDNQRLHIQAWGPQTYKIWWVSMTTAVDYIKTQ